jgi:hypothetical protein
LRNLLAAQRLSLDYPERPVYMLALGPDLVKGLMDIPAGLLRIGLNLEPKLAILYRATALPEPRCTQFM